MQGINHQPPRKGQRRKEALAEIAKIMGVKEFVDIEI